MCKVCGRKFVHRFLSLPPLKGINMSSAPRWKTSTVSHYAHVPLKIFLGEGRHHGTASATRRKHPAETQLLPGPVDQKRKQCARYQSPAPTKPNMPVTLSFHVAISLASSQCPDYQYMQWPCRPETVSCGRYFMTITSGEMRSWRLDWLQSNPRRRQLIAHQTVRRWRPYLDRLFDITTALNTQPIITLVQQF